MFRGDWMNINKLFKYFLNALISIFMIFYVAITGMCSVYVISEYDLLTIEGVYLYTISIYTLIIYIGYYGIKIGWIK